MFRKILVCLALLIFCMPFVCAEAADAPKAYVNSWGYAWPHMLYTQGNLYCFSREQFLWMDFGRLFSVSQSNIREVASMPGLEKIEAYQGKILLSCREKNVGELLANAPGTESLHLFDPATEKISPLMKYDVAASGPYFTGNDQLYHGAFDGSSLSFYRLDEEGDVFLFQQDGRMISPYPTFLLLSIQEWTRAFRWPRTEVMVYDFASGKILESEQKILPSNADVHLQGVLSGGKLYYLSSKGISVLDFRGGGDSVLLYLSEQKYERFSLSESKAVLYYQEAQSWHAAIYDLYAGSCVWTVALAFNPLEVHVTDKEMYVYNHYAALMEYIDLTTGEQTVFPIRH